MLDVHTITTLMLESQLLNHLVVLILRKTITIISRIVMKLFQSLPSQVFLSLAKHYELSLSTERVNCKTYTIADSQVTPNYRKEE